LTLGCFSILFATASVAALFPVASTTYAGTYSAGPLASQALPEDLLAAQDLTLHRFTNDDINNSLVSINPNIFLAGVDANQFVVPTLPGSPCRLGCGLVLDIEALQTYLGPSIAIRGIAVAMYQVGLENEGSMTLKQGFLGQTLGLPFSTEDSKTLLYRAALFDNPADLVGLSMEIGLTVGHKVLSRGLWADAYYITARDARAVPEPTMPGLGALVVLGVVISTRPARAKCPRQRP